MARIGRAFPIKPHINYQGYIGIYFNRPQTVTPSAQVTTLATVSPTVVYDFVITPSVQVLTTVIITPSVVYDNVVQVGVQQTTVAIQTPTVLTPDVSVITSTQAVVIAIVQSQVVYDTVISVGVQALVSEKLTPTVTGGVVVSDISVQETSLTLLAGTYYASGYFDKFEAQSDVYQIKY